MSKVDNKELEEAITMFKNLNMGNDEEFKKARSTILKELTRLQEENNKMKTEIAEHVYWESTPVAEIKNLYIAKDQIREKLEEVKKYERIEMKKLNHKSMAFHYANGRETLAKEILKELLEGK